MRLIVALVLVMLLPTIAHAQEQNQKEMIPSVTVTGEASVAAEPDQTEIEIGVVTESKTAHEAAEENPANGSYGESLVQEAPESRQRGKRFRGINSQIRDWLLQYLRMARIR